MKRFAATALFNLILLVFLLAVFEGLGCSFDRSGLPISDLPDPVEFHKCSTKLKHCAQGQLSVQVSASVAPPNNTGGAYQIDTDFRVNDHLYINSPNQWIVQSIEHPPVRGGTLVRTDWNHWNVTSGDFLGVDFPSFEHVEDVYVAYDSRVLPKPQWLMNQGQYLPVTDAGGKPLHIVTYTPDASNAGPTVKLQLYKVAPAAKIKGHPIGAPMWKVPGNNCFALTAPGAATCTGKVKWSKVPDKNKAMFVVIVTRKPAPNCKQGTIDEQNIYESCDANKTVAYNAADKKCEEARQKKAQIGQNPAYFQCLSPNCRVEVACPKQSGLVQTRWFTVSSVVEFEPAKYKSEAEIRVKGKKFTKKVEGLAYFEYLLDEFGTMKRLRLDAMTLDVEDIDSDVGKFTDIVIALRDRARATCQESPPPWAGDRPCTNYTIPSGAFKALLGAQDGKKVLLFDPVNQGTLDIKIDHKSRTFQIKGGPLSTAVMVNGKSTPLEIDIDLFGHFLNFAPHAVGGAESTKWVECAGGRDKSRSNKDSIHLDSAGSFEVYKDPIPQKAFEWYEDYTWPSQKLWGTGERLTIAPYQMSLGVHNMTLLIRDPFGIADTDSFPVEVRDTKPPVLTVPPDAYYLVTPPDRPPVKVPLGTAWAYDICFGDVAITNDAPADGRFPAGVTPVNWTAEDGAGNTDTGVQKVHVFTAPRTRDPRTLVPTIKDFTKDIKAGIDKSKSAADRCDPNELRAARTEGLARSASQAAGLTERMEVAPGREEARREAVEMLRLSQSRLGEADRLIEEAGTTRRESDRREACGAAAGALGDAGGIIVKVGPALDGAASAAPIVPPPGAAPPIEPPPGEQPPIEPPGFDAGARCEDYARISAAHGAENRERGCGFQGGRWSEDFRPHFEWCLRHAAREADEIMQARIRALREECRPQPVPMPFEEPRPPIEPPYEPPPYQPPSYQPPAYQPPPPAAPSGKEAFCQTYAQQAVASNQQNLSRGCGFGGPRWLSDHGAHYGWCMSVPQFLADMERNARADQLGRCGAAAPPPAAPPPPWVPPAPPPGAPPQQPPHQAPDNQARCAAYARQAVSQANQNISRRCGFTGPRWNTDYNVHYNWCLGTPAAVTNGETQARSSDLANRCRGLPVVQ